MQPQRPPQHEFINPTLQLEAPPNAITPGDEAQLQRIFSMPIVKQYLQHLLWNQIVDQANIPITALMEEQQAHILRVAYIKGGIGMLQTLLSIAESRTED